MIKVLIVTNMYPFKGMDYFGNFLKNEVEFINSNEDIKADVFFVNGRIDKKNYITNLIKFMKIYKKYDVIHYHHSYVAWYSYFVKNKIQIFTIHEGGNIHIKNDMLIPGYGHGRNSKLEGIFKLLNLREKIFNKMDKIIVTKISNHDCYFNNKKIMFNPMGIDFEKFNIYDIEESKSKIDVDIKEGEIVLLFPNEPRKEKNIELFEKVSGKIEERLGVKVKKLYGGKISHNEMQYFINISDICYLTSEFEASPTIAKETIACGKIILTTDVGDLRELFGTKFYDWICKDEEEFIKKSMNIIKNNNLDREKIRKHGINKGISIEDTAKNVCNLYRGFYKNTGE